MRRLFGFASEVGSTQTFQVYADNGGPDPLTIQGVEIEDDSDDAFSIASVPLATSIPADMAVDITLTFRPMAASRFLATLVVMSDDLGHERMTLGLFGEGFVRPRLYREVPFSHS